MNYSRGILSIGSSLTDRQGREAQVVVVKGNNIF